jgi:hypothetical protein
LTTKITEYIKKVAYHTTKITTSSASLRIYKKYLSESNESILEYLKKAGKALKKYNKKINLYRKYWSAYLRFRSKLRCHAFYRIRVPKYWFRRIARIRVYHYY